MQETHNLIVDIGNSRVKYHYRDKTYSSVEELFVVLNESIRLVIVSTDKSKNASAIEALQARLAEQIETIIDFDPLVQNIITDLYPGIGADRVAKLIGTQNLLPKSNILLVDFGTAMTSSLLSSANRFLGGYINLGFRSSLKALGEYCYQLNDYSDLPDFKPETALGKSPETAIVHGTYLQTLAQITAIKSKVQEAFATEQFVTVCTGGDAEFFADNFDHHFADIKILSMFAKSL